MNTPQKRDSHFGRHPSDDSAPTSLDSAALAIGTALQQGNKTEAIRLFRDAFGFTTRKKSEPPTEQFRNQRPAGPVASDGLSPGEMPKSKSGAWLVAIAAAFLGIYLLERFG